MTMTRQQCPTARKLVLAAISAKNKKLQRIIISDNCNNSMSTSFTAQISRILFIHCSNKMIC